MHQRQLNDQNEKEGEDVSGNAVVQVLSWDGGVVRSPELVEVVQGGEEECEEEGSADDAGY